MDVDYNLSLLYFVGILAIDLMSLKNETFTESNKRQSVMLLECFITFIKLSKLENLQMKNFYCV